MLIWGVERKNKVYCFVTMFLNVHSVGRCKSILRAPFFIQITKRFSSNISQHRAVHNQSIEPNTKLYEIRTYNIYPEHIKEFLQLTTEWIHLRTKRSKLIGYWTTELGGINEVTHIWEYDSYSHRMSVRNELGKDSEWLKNYFSKIGKMMAVQDNSMMKLFPFSQLQTDLPQGGVYQLQTFQFTFGDVTEWNSMLEAYSTARQKHQTSIGTFQTYMAGLINTSVQLWHYPDPSHIETVQQACQNDQDVNSKYSHLRPLVTKETAKILIPQPFSPLG